MIDEEMSLAEYRQEWEQLAVFQRNRLAAALELPEIQIEHIGSTAVPGLIAKPVIDLMVGLAAIPPEDAVEKRLIEIGYRSHGEAGVSGRWYFTSRGEQAFNVHVVQFGTRHWHDNLAVRDLLRRSADARQRYVDAKRRAIAGGAATLLAYSAVKADTVEQLVREANDGDLLSHS